MSLVDGLGKPRTLGVLLAIAVGINLLLVGVIAGRVSAGWMHPPQEGLRYGAGMNGMPGHPPRAMMRAMRDAMPDLREQQREMQRLHRNVAEELAKATPDRAALERSMAGIREKMSAMQQALQTAFLDVALKLPPEERREMLEEMSRMRHGLRHHGPGPAPGMPFDPPPPPPESP